MRTSQLITSYIQAVVFAALGIRCVMSWLRDRDRRSAHLAWAAGLFALSSALGAITSTIYDATKGELAPHWEQVLSSIILFLSVYAFLLFLSDFVPFPRWAHGFLILLTIAAIVFAIIERPDFRFDPTKGFVPIPGVDNPISYRAYVSALLIYLAVAFGILAVAFLGYGFRTAGFARFRMLCIGAGFFLLFVVIGLLPRLLFGGIKPETITSILNVVRYIALVSGPLLLIGFAPPTFVRTLFGEQASRAEEATQRG